MDVAYINPFILGVREVFDTMVRLPLCTGKPRLRQPDDRTDKLYSISVVIELSGAVSGLLVMSLAQQVALALATALSGEEIDYLDNDAMDALAEIANMIAGSAKKRIPSGQVNITVPKLLLAADVVYPTGQPMIALPFDSPMGRFILEIAVKSTKIAASA